MSSVIIYQDSFLVSTLMCHEDCGVTVEGALENSLQECIKQGCFPRMQH